MPAKIGYMVPEFPGLTHVFFWREIAELEKLGVGVNVVSTRLPSAGLPAHGWAEQAMRRTSYLHPLRLRDLRDLFAVSWTGLLRSVNLIRTARDLAPGERLKLLLILPHAIKLAARARREGWQHLHCHFTFRGADVVLFASLLSKVPYSMSSHGSDWGVGNQVNKWRHASFGSVVTQVALRELRATRGDHLPPEMVVLSMGVQVDKFKRAAPYRPWDGTGELRLFSCGRLDREKAHQTTILTVSELRRREVPATLRIAGSLSRDSAPYGEELQRLVHAEGLEKQVTFLGAIAEDHVVRELERAHAFVLASLKEPLGIAYVEAMSMELPTIGTNSGGVPELIHDRETGFLVEPGAPDAIADTVEWIVAHPDEARAIGQRAREFVVGHYQSGCGARTLCDAVERSVARRQADELPASASVAAR